MIVTKYKCDSQGRVMLPAAVCRAADHSECDSVMSLAFAGSRGVAQNSHFISAHH